MRHSRLHAHLVAAFAADHAIQIRAAQGHRARGSPEWSAWIAERAAVVPVATMVSRSDDNPGAGGEDIVGPVGLQAEIERARAECRDLAAEIERRKGGDVVLRVGLMRALNESRRTLREMERDLCSIMEQAGSVLPTSRFVAYAAQVRSVIETLPARLGTIVPAELAAEVRERVAAEIAAVVACCGNINLAAA